MLCGPRASVHTFYFNLCERNVFMLVLFCECHYTDALQVARNINVR